MKTSDYGIVVNSSALHGLDGLFDPFSTKTLCAFCERMERKGLHVSYDRKNDMCEVEATAIRSSYGIPFSRWYVQQSGRPSRSGIEWDGTPVESVHIISGRFWECTGAAEILSGLAPEGFRSPRIWLNELARLLSEGCLTPGMNRIEMVRLTIDSYREDEEEHRA